MRSDYRRKVVAAFQKYIHDVSFSHPLLYAFSSLTLQLIIRACTFQENVITQLVKSSDAQIHTSIPIANRSRIDPRSDDHAEPRR